MWYGGDAMTDRIQEETILMPYVIADCAVAELEHFFYARGLGNLDNRRELADALVAKAEGCYARGEPDGRWVRYDERGEVQAHEVWEAGRLRRRLLTF